MRYDRRERCCACHHTAATHTPHTCRDKVIIATKVAGPSGQMVWIRGGPHKVDAVNIGAAIDASLSRLGTDYIDLYQVRAGGSGRGVTRHLGTVAEKGRKEWWHNSGKRGTRRGEAREVEARGGAGRANKARWSVSFVMPYRLWNGPAYLPSCLSNLLCGL